MEIRTTSRNSLLLQCVVAVFTPWVARHMCDAAQSKSMRSRFLARCVAACALLLVVAGTAHATSSCYQWKLTIPSGSQTFDSGWSSSDPLELFRKAAMWCSAQSISTTGGSCGISCYMECRFELNPAVSWGTWPDITYQMTWKGKNSGGSFISGTGGGQAVSFRSNPNGCMTYVSALVNPAAAARCDMVGDPINPSCGSMHEAEIDAPQSGTLRFQRYYFSRGSYPSDEKTGWFHTYVRRLIPVYEGTGYRGAYASSADNSSLYSTESSACTSGFAEIKSRVASWTSATASFSGGVCALTVGSTVVAHLPVYYSSPPTVNPASSTLIGRVALRDDGQEVTFRLSGSSYVAPSNTPMSLSSSVGGFTLVNLDDETESYDVNGMLQSIASRSGVVHAVSYNGDAKPIAITDSFGNSLTLSYDNGPSFGPTSLTLPGSITYQYGLSTDGQLTSVTNPDATTRTFLYEDTSNPRSMTGIEDENANRIATWTYDSSNRATSSEQGGVGAATTLTYNSDGSVAVTDPLGAVREFTFSRHHDRNQLAGVSGSRYPNVSAQLETVYDLSGYPTRKVDYNGNSTCYSHDSARGLELVRVEGFSASVTACPSSLSSYVPASGTDERKVTTTWHSTFRLPTQIVQVDRTIGFTHDSHGNVLTRTVTDTSVTPNQSRTWTYTYNGFGQVLTEDGPRTDVSDVTTYTYYNCTSGFQCGQVYTITNAASQVTTFDSYNAQGQPTQITDPNGVVTSLSYDVRQRLTARCVNGSLPGCSGGELTAMEYWPTGLLKKVTMPGGEYISYGYDVAHRLTSITDNVGNRIDYTLDALGNQTLEEVHDPTNSLRRTHSRVFNTLSQLYQDVNASSTGAATTSYTYDDNGNQTAVNAPLSRSTASLYDALNRLTQLTDPASGNTSFTYDANDNLSTVTDPRGLVTSYAYNGFGDLVVQTSPDTGVTGNTYDSGGNISTSADARGAVATYSYDALNRVTGVSYTKGSVTDQSLVFTYDAGTYGKGKLTDAADANHSMSWVYDAQGRVSGSAITVGSVTSTIGYGYSSGRLTTMTLPSGNVLTYGYNSNGQISSIQVGSTTILDNVTYEPFGPVKGWSWGNAETHARSYDQDGRVTALATSFTNGINQTYSFDGASRITGISDTGSTPNSWTYGYDALDRLTSGSGPSQIRGWTYDANGNRLSETGTQATTFTVSSTSNRLDSATGFLGRTYAYDASGNALSYSDVTLTYNNRNRLASTQRPAGTRIYIYNAIGQMAKASGGAGGTVLYVYDEVGHLIGEYDGSGGLIQETVWLGDIPVATLRPGSPVEINYVHSDHLGAPVRITRTSDNARRWQWNRDPFGSLPADQDPESVGVFAYDLRFPGQILDGQAGIHQNYFRDYSPAIGRYVESDPVGLTAGINTYSYALSRPSLLIDPLGTETAYVYNGPTFPFHGNNPFGHSGVATTGSGIRSYGNDTAIGSSLTEYLQKQAPLRHSVVVVLPTTPAQESRISDFLKKFPEPNRGIDYDRTCATRVSDAFWEAGLFSNALMSRYPGAYGFPRQQLDAVLAIPGARVFNIPRNGQIPEALRQFNPRKQ